VPCSHHGPLGDSARTKNAQDATPVAAAITPLNERLELADLRARDNVVQVSYSGRTTRLLLHDNRTGNLGYVAHVIRTYLKFVLGAWSCWRAAQSRESFGRSTPSESAPDASTATMQRIVPPTSDARSGVAPSCCAGVMASACTQGKRREHGKPRGVLRDEQSKAGDGQADRPGWRRARRLASSAVQSRGPKLAYLSYAHASELFERIRWQPGPTASLAVVSCSPID